MSTETQPALSSADAAVVREVLKVLRLRFIAGQTPHQGPEPVTKGIPRDLEPLVALLAAARADARDRINDYHDQLRELATVTRERDDLRVAALEMSIPYRALLMDAPSRKWIAPEVWAGMEKGIALLDAALRAAGGEG